jgi:DNA primase large subunit
MRYGHRYPFTSDAKRRYRFYDSIELVKLIEENEFYELIIKRAKERIIGTLRGEITDPEDPSYPDPEFFRKALGREFDGVEEYSEDFLDKKSKRALSYRDAEILSFALVKLILSCLRDNYLIRRFALREAEYSKKKLEEEREEILVKVAEELGVEIERTNGKYLLHFTSFVKYATKIRGTQEDFTWRLVNRDLNRGFLTLTKSELIRLLQEAIREKIESELPLNVGKDVCNHINFIIDEMRDEIEEFREKIFEDVGEFEESALPPCIENLFRMALEGKNLPHASRFALTSFLLSIGMNVDEIVSIYRNSPDFDEEKTRYQVRHINGATGTKYTPPSCETMKVYGDCLRSKVCGSAKHPLQVYRKLKRSKVFERDRSS